RGGGARGARRRGLHHHRRQHGVVDQGTVRGRRRAVAADPAGHDRGGGCHHRGDRGGEVSDGAPPRPDACDAQQRRVHGVRIQTLTVGPFQENTYLLIDEATRRAVFIDPGAEAPRLLAALHASGAELDAIWLTHAHVDHVGAIAALKRSYDVPIYLHPSSEPLYRAAVSHGLLFGLQVEEPPPADRPLAEGDTLHVGQLAFQVMHTPGHEPGHVVIHGHGVAFVGDCLFAGSVGRTDLPLANGAALARSLERICALGDATVVYPGHGPATTIGRERAENPFLIGVVRIVGAE